MYPQLLIDLCRQYETNYIPGFESVLHDAFLDLNMLETARHFGNPSCTGHVIGKGCVIIDEILRSRGTVDSPLQYSSSHEGQEDWVKISHEFERLRDVGIPGAIQLSDTRESSN